jgi:hypothetical protein
MCTPTTVFGATQERIGNLSVAEERTARARLKALAEQDAAILRVQPSPAVTQMDRLV